MQYTTCYVIIFLKLEKTNEEYNLGGLGMKKYIREEGITLVALVVTIIILLILATISIQSLTNTGLFENANKAKLETKRSQISEWLGLEVISEQTNNPTGSAEQIINQTHKNVLTFKDSIFII